MTTGSDRADLIAQVWDLHSTARMTVRAIAVETGLPRSTVGDYIAQGRAAEGYIKLLDREEQRTAMAERLDAYTAISMSEHQRGMKWDRVLPLLIQLETRRARLLGLDAPTQVLVDDGRETGMNPETIAAVRAAQERASQERREIGAPPRDGKGR